MSYVRILVFAVLAIGNIAFLVLVLNTGVAELFTVAEPFVAGTWAETVLDRWKIISYALIVPIFLIDVLVYVLIGTIQTERNERVVRRTR
jgi:hypothetical protein